MIGGAPSRTSPAVLLAGIPAPGGRAGEGPLLRREAYGETWREGERIVGGDLRAALAGDDIERRDLAATLHGCAGWDALQATRALAEPAAFLGHSLGLYAAAYAARAIDLAAALRLAGTAARAIIDTGRERGSGLLVVLGLPLARIEEIALARGCEIANENAQAQGVVGGPPLALEEVRQAALAAGALDARPIVAPLAIHTTFAAEAALRVARHVERDLEIAPPRGPLVSALDGRILRSAQELREELARNIATRIRWPRALHALRELGCAALVDVGPGDALGRLSRACERDLTVTCLDSEREARAALAFLSTAPHPALEGSPA